MIFDIIPNKLHYPQGKRPKFERKTVKNDVVLDSGWYWVKLVGKIKWEIVRYQKNMDQFCLINYGRKINRSTVGRSLVEKIDPRPLHRKRKYGRPYQTHGDWLWD